MTARRLRVVLIPLAVLGRNYPAPLVLSEQVMSEQDGLREIRNTYGTGATSPHSISVLTCTGLAGARPDQAMVEPEQKEGRRPLPDEDCPIVFLSEFE
jgi:hypothetical protein